MYSVYKLAKKNYPTQWNKAMIDHLLEIGRLTQEEYDDVINSAEGQE